jgi:hypothetical protein
MSEIHSVEQLQAIHRQLRLVSLIHRVPFYQFAIPDLPESSNRDASQLMSNYRNACGCVTGGLLMGVTAIGFIAHYLASGRGIAEFGLKDSVVFLALFVGSTLAGKMLGVLWARGRMVQVVRRMVATANRQALNA